ncbi:MAG TPA: Holliday junction resolvase RuvX [Thermoanaerobaculia bacterium]
MGASDLLRPGSGATLLGIDFGGRRIGIAVSTSGVLATPHSVMSNDGDAIEKLARLGDALEVSLFVFGIPRRAGSAAERKYRELAETLRQRTCKEVILWDESLSTVEASETLRASGRRRREAQKDIDMHAAAAILQSYLDHCAGRRS